MFKESNKMIQSLLKYWKLNKIILTTNLSTVIRSMNSILQSHWCHKANLMSKTPELHISNLSSRLIRGRNLRTEAGHLMILMAGEVEIRILPKRLPLVIKRET